MSDTNPPSPKAAPKVAAADIVAAVAAEVPDAITLIEDCIKIIDGFLNVYHAGQTVTGSTAKRLMKNGAKYVVAK